MKSLLTICIPILDLTASLFNDIISLWFDRSCGLTHSVTVFICAKNSEIKPSHFNYSPFLSFSVIVQSNSDEKIYGAMNEVHSLSDSSFICYMGYGDYLYDLQFVCQYLYRWRNASNLVFYLCPNFNHFLKSLFFPIASEACHQQLIYSTDHPNFATRLKVNSDHLLNLQIGLSKRGLRILRIPSSFYFGPGGVSSSQEDPFYYYYRQCQPLVGNSPHLRLSYLTSCLLRKLLRRNIRFERIYRSGNFKVFIISNRPRHLFLCLTSLLSSYTQLPEDHQKFFEVNVLFDDRLVESDLSFDSFSSQFKHFSFLRFSQTPLSPSSSGRSELRNYLVDSVQPCVSPYDTYVFIDGDVVLPNCILHSLWRSAKKSPWGMFPVAYRSKKDCNLALSNLNHNLLPVLSIKRLISYFISLNCKRLAVLVRYIIGKYSNFFFAKYSPTLQSGVLFINSQVFHCTGGFVSVHADPTAWGGEDAFLGQRLYEKSLLPNLFGLRCLSHHLYHHPVTQSERDLSASLLKVLP